MNAWTDEAACAGRTDLDFFGTEDEDGTGRTMKQAVLDEVVLLCNRCPVSRECAEFSVRSGAVERYGIWAGCIPSRRRALVDAFPDPAEAAQAILSDLDYNAGQALWRVERAARPKRKRAPLGVVQADGLIHGRARYYKHGCRCAICVDARESYMELARERRAN